MKLTIEFDREPNIELTTAAYEMNLTDRVIYFLDKNDKPTQCLSLDGIKTITETITYFGRRYEKQVYPCKIPF